MTIKYIFSINTGRSGSDYLSGLLSQATNTASLHEGLPLMNGRPMQAFNQGDEASLQALMPLKLAEIQKQRKNGQKIYCETNHSFIKGWGYLIPDAYIPQEEIGVIILDRDIDKIAYSLLRLHDVPDASEWTRTWYLSAHGQRNLSRPAAAANPYELCQWYVAEVRLRTAEYKSRFPRITYFDCQLEQLNDYAFVCRMFDTFGLIPAKALKSVVGQPLNPRNEWPKLPLEELLAEPKYPSANDLSTVERDTLVADMVAYLQKHKTAELASLQPDWSLAGSTLFSLTSVFAQVEAELEEAFQISLRFTEMEQILLIELLYTLTPQDFIFIVTKRSPPPNLHFCYDFNKVFGLGTMLQALGPTAVFKMIWLMLKGKWGQDYSHRAGQ